MFQETGKVWARPESLPTVYCVPKMVGCLEKGFIQKACKNLAC